MKRKRADRADWRRILKKRFSGMQLTTPAFTGAVTLLQIDEVREPLVITLQGKRECIADEGYSWLQHFPVGTRYTLTTMFDAQGDLIQWYIDICKQHGIDSDDVPWYDDLYLDIAMLPTGEPLLLDVEELDEALRQGKITPTEYDFAWREADTILAAIEADLFPLLWIVEEHLGMLKG